MLPRPQLAPADNESVTTRWKYVAWALAAIAAVTAAWAARPPDPQSLDRKARESGKVLVIGIPGVNWEDIENSGSPELLALASKGGRANVSVRVTNQAAEGYATLGAGQRVQTDPSAGWAFDALEKVENGSAAQMFRRRTGQFPRGLVVIPTIDQLIERNSGRAFDATPGLLGEAIKRLGGRTAVIGNADPTLGALPAVLPNPAQMLAEIPPDTRIHRDAALAATRRDGTVAIGAVGRDMLEAEPSAPYGVATSVDAVTAKFRTAWALAELVVVETGDTARADAYSLGLPEEERTAMRATALRRAGVLVGALLSEVDLESTLIVVIAPTTPGGPQLRGQLRPVILAGPSIPNGLLTSTSTRRPGLIWMPDLTTEIAIFLGIAETRFGAGRPVSLASPTRQATLADANLRALVHDRLRTPISAVIILMQLLMYIVALMRLRKGPLRGWMIFLLLAALAFPLGSFMSRAWIWHGGVGAGAGGVVAVTLLIALIASKAGRRNHLGAANLIVGATLAFFVLDMVAGAPMQLDSIFGYTSVAAGRFYGLGNLGFALMAAASLLVAGAIAASNQPFGTRSRFVALAVLGVTILAVGHPRLGNDVGGTLTLIPAAIVFAASVFVKGRFPRKLIPVAAAVALGTVLIFGLIDLARPEGQRSHLGDFLANLAADPISAWLVIKRKVGLAAGIATGTYWGLAVPGALIASYMLYRMAGSRTRSLFQDRGLGAGLRGLVVAGIVGSLVNDSGVAIAGMMLALATPWLILAASKMGPAP